MLLRSARGCFQIAQRAESLRLRPACSSRQHLVNQRLHLSMAQKSITSFFKGPEKRKGTDESATGADKKQKASQASPLAWPPCQNTSNYPVMLNRCSILQVGITVAAAVSKDGEATVAAVKTAPTAREGADLPPAPKLSTEELRTLANRWTIKGLSSAAGPIK